MTFNQEQALKDYAHFMRRVRVGAYSERSWENYENGTWPEDGIEESVHNLEELAAKDDLVFCFEASNGTYVLLPMSDETRQARAQAQEYQDEESEDLVASQMQRIESPGYNELGEDEPLYHFPDDEEEEEYEHEGDGSGLHQCAYCYDLVYEGHEEFCRLNPNRNREIMP
jgi:hypothetical protein